MLILGAFDQDGAPTVRFRVSAPGGKTLEYVGIVDTGFTGFVALPLAEMVPLRLVTQPAAASVRLGNGTITYNLIANGTVVLLDQQRPATILLDDTSAEALVGMALLRAFDLALIVTDTAVVLHDRSEILEVVARFMATAPEGQPNTVVGVVRSGTESGDE